MHLFILVKLVSIKVGQATALKWDKNENGQFPTSHCEIAVNLRGMRSLVSQIRAVVIGYKQY